MPAAVPSSSSPVGSSARSTLGRAASVDAPTHVMELEHDAVGSLLEELRGRTDAYRAPVEACGSWRGLYQGLDELERDLMRHVHIENHVLFPLARAVEKRLSLRA